MVRANKKTVTVPNALGLRTDNTPYHEITDPPPAMLRPIAGDALS